MILYSRKVPPDARDGQGAATYVLVAYEDDPGVAVVEIRPDGLRTEIQFCLAGEESARRWLAGYLSGEWPTWANGRDARPGPGAADPDEAGADPADPISNPNRWSAAERDEAPPRTRRPAHPGRSGPEETLP